MADRRAHPYRIRLADAADVARLPAIERAAATAFEPGLIPDHALAETTPIDALAEAREAGRLWVACAPDGEVVGFAVVGLVAGEPHLEEIDVHPAHGRRGVGRALLGALLDWARAAGHPAVTLTTFRDVAWNAPFYARMGFRVLDRAEITPELQAIVRAEGARGFDPDRRVVMRCALSR